MSITLDEGIRGLWYCSLVPDKQDFLMSLSLVEEGHYEITYRFRYYNSDDPFDPEDKKDWFRAKITNLKEKEVIEKARVVAHSFATFANAELTEVLRDNRPLDKFTEEFMKQEFVHVKSVH